MPTREGLMREIIVGLLAIAIATISVHGAVARKAKDYPNSGFCQSGKHLKDIANCKENGGRK